jgi:hypothetical protein
MVKTKIALSCEVTVLHFHSFTFSTQRTHILRGKTILILA